VIAPVRHYWAVEIAAGTDADRYRAVTDRDLPELVRAGRLPADELLAMRAVAAVLPFKSNRYVVDELIDWSAVPDDPMFRLTFPQPDMLARPDLHRVMDLLRREAPPAELLRVVTAIRLRLNPHPDGQRTHNAPLPDNSGLQHKYAETLLVFPRPGQTCHAYCTYCFRWAQFVGDPGLRMATGDAGDLTDYLKTRPGITDVLITGGDPLVMSTSVLERYVLPLLEIDTVATIRIGTKALSFWPHRFVTDRDADDLLRLFERIVAGGRHLALMAHFSHPRELAAPVTRRAVERIRATGAVIRGQAPIIRGVNDAAATWVELWRDMVHVGAVPYYCFVERDTGPRDHFAVPLARCHELFRDAYSQVTGLARTVRGPIMSALPGKVCIDGTADVNGHRVFVLRLLQARDARLVGRPFFAEYDDTARWFTDLKPALGAPRFLPELDMLDC